jgi:hypothetical protein
MTIGGKAYGGAGDKAQATPAQSPAGSAPAK